jgi:NAD(P)-dependent dehydrogenase (short-subunit alcohol dehydrogenase family)
MSRTALITGTSTGIGLSTAIALSRAGFSVVATMRDPGKADALLARAKREGLTVDVRALDVQDDDSVERCVGVVLCEHGHIDVLVNNAGAGHFGTTEQVSFDELSRTMDVNFYGVYRVTRAVLPSMRAARSGRIVSVTSIGGLVGQPFNDAYCAAKFAVEGMMESLAPVMKRLGVHISLIEPGPVLTEFVASARQRADAGPAVPDHAYQPLAEAYLAATQQAFSTVGQTGDDVAKVIVEAATAEAPQLRYATSEVVRGIVGRKYVDPTGASALALAGGRLS